VSERVVLYLLPLGVVVTWFVTGWRPAVPGPGQSPPAAADPKPIRERHLRAVLAEYQAHYNTARPHQGIAQHMPNDEPSAPRATVTDFGTQQIRRKPVMGGLINEYAHAA
jgi:hypothetical protein